MAVGCIRVSALYCPQVTEALAIFHGLRFAFKTGLSPLHVKSDCLEMIKVLQDGSISCSDLDLVISVIFSLNYFLHVLSFSFVLRLVNKVADALAKMTISSVSDLFWIKSCTPFVETLVLNDLPG
ncbi:hypothetical protein ACOSP7_032019 [Xanthoceras sorbifolium]